MKPISDRKIVRLTAFGLIAVSLGACGNTLSRLSEVGDGPKVTEIVNPIARPDYRPVSLPMPAPKVAEDNPNSLWRAGAKAFFKDHRAKNIGDVVTVKLALDDSANFENKTERERDDKEDTNVSSLLGLEAEFAKVLPEAVSPGSLSISKFKLLLTSQISFICFKVIRRFFVQFLLLSNTNFGF